MEQGTVAPETIGGRLVACREFLGLGQTAMARKMEMSPSTLKNIEGDANVPNGETLLGYAALGFNPGWILTGLGGMHLARDAQSQVQSQDDSSIVMVEHLSFSASAGSGALVLNDLGRKFPVRTELLQRLGLRAEFACMVEAVGISMVPTINDTDVLLVDKSPAAKSPIREGEIYLFTVDNEAYIKRLRRDPGQWIMVSDNQEMFPPRPIPPHEHFDIIGRVRWGAREL